jgi:hypothetical protein
LYNRHDLFKLISLIYPIILHERNSFYFRMNSLIELTGKRKLLMKKIPYTKAGDVYASSFLIMFSKQMIVDTMVILMDNNLGRFKYYWRGWKLVHIFSKISADQLLNSPVLIGKLRDIGVNEILMCRILRNYPPKYAVRLSWRI